MHAVLAPGERTVEDVNGQRQRGVQRRRGRRDALGEAPLLRRRRRQRRRRDRPERRRVQRSPVRSGEFSFMIHIW